MYARFMLSVHFIRYHYTPLSLSATAGGSVMTVLLSFPVRIVYGMYVVCDYLISLFPLCRRFMLLPPSNAQQFFATARALSMLPLTLWSALEEEVSVAHLARFFNFQQEMVTYRCNPTIYNPKLTDGHTVTLSSRTCTS